MSKTILNPDLKGQYRMKKGYYPGKYQVPGFGIIDFRIATPAQVEALIKHGTTLVEKVPTKTKNKET